MRYVLDILPEPVKKTRFFVRNGRVCTYNPSKPYENKIKKILISKYGNIQPIYSAVSISLSFYLPPGNSVSKRKKSLMLERKIHHIKKPDLDNLAYSVINACKGILYKDDSQIIFSIYTKSYSIQPRIEINIQEYISEQSND